ncbi:hypothetical protein DICPUDRAFT_51923 [Dictyostelium purpureum]|uniref:SGTA homodimerisation domain-containing protein n=1 Tax=Dictyostelium purpureum TaxID=5786 RepID=F1A663_DICPU|nr:uncharacterized protein DICPUDRAFT_51923 [Dictyostelium purpureum]EGC28318.1 hypothetical protein DICPUDRAFT_51923 [Dictyostelium purpureum]|eukprot:XP_003295156.1 hypothetical protein DICPUDRAFT_51923 [Dictyostelium purpureum]
MADNNKKLAVSILQFLKESTTNDSDSAESIQVAVECIRDVFGVDEKDTSLQVSTPLSTIFENYLNNNTSASTTSTTTTTTKKSKEELLEKAYSEIPAELLDSFKQFINIIEQKGAFNNPDQIEPVLNASKQKFIESKKNEIKAIAEKIKVEGNNKLNEGDTKGALECYNKAILYDDSNAIYFANRGATYATLKMYNEAISDCKEAIKRNPKYGKAYNRMGSAYASLGSYEEAIDAYQKAVDIEPNNETFKASLSAAQKFAQNGEEEDNGMGGLGNIPGMPDLSGIDINGLMSNPMIRNMANQFMQNPQMAESLKNGDIGSMLNNPEVLNMMKMFGKK